MKKIFPISLIGALLLSFLIPFGSAFAYEGGLLHGKGLFYNSSLDWDSQFNNNLKVTDGDTGTSVYVFGNQSGHDYVYYRFDNPVNITHYQVLANKSPDSFYLITNSGNISINNPNLSGVKTEFAASNVTGFVFENDGGSSHVMLNEIDLFGTGSIEVPISYDEVTNLSLVPFHDKISLTWNIPTDNADFTGTKIYKNGVFLTSVDDITDVFTDTDVLPNTSYTYKITAVYVDGHETNGMTVSTTTDSEPVDESTIPPSNVTNLQAIDITGNSAKLTWTNSADEDLDKVNIYKDDNSLLTSIPVVSEYVISNLNPETTYKYSVALVDTDGNIGAKSPVTFTTIKEADIIAPTTPKDLTVDSGNNALYVSWDKNSEVDLQGYNIYVDGVKVNDVVVKNSFYTVSGLENDVTYDIQISAVDKTGNESVFSTIVAGTPSDSALPIIGMDYSLQDVASGVEKWFGSQWLILAFAISIPLSFYIAARIKLMFLD